MPYNATVIQVLLSSPSDLPDRHKKQIEQAIHQWNVEYSKTFSILFTCTDWKTGAAPNTGLDAQGIINEQIVDDSDAAIVILTDKLGTPTASGYPSGTAEEIDRMVKAGKLVSVLINNESRPPLHADALTEKAKLEEFVNGLRENALTEEYEDILQLNNMISRILVLWSKKYRKELESGQDHADKSSKESQPFSENDFDVPFEEERGIWPHIETSEQPRIDPKGRLRTSRKYRLILQSTLPYQAKDVTFRYEDNEGQPSNLSLRDPEEYFDVTPNGSVSFPILAAMGTDRKANCIISWNDPEGKSHSTKSFVSL